MMMMMMMMIVCCVFRRSCRLPTLTRQFIMIRWWRNPRYFIDYVVISHTNTYTVCRDDVARIKSYYLTNVLCDMSTWWIHCTMLLSITARIWLYQTDDLRSDCVAEFTRVEEASSLDTQQAGLVPCTATSQYCALSDSIVLVTVSVRVSGMFRLKCKLTVGDYCDWKPYI